MNWFDSQKRPKLKSVKKGHSHSPDGLWKKCSHCLEILAVSRLEENNEVCPYCSFHFPLSAKKRIELLADEGSFREDDREMVSKDPLGFEDKKTYRKRLKEAQERAGRGDGVIAGQASLNGREISLVVMDFSFMGGSMGVVCGEKIARAMDRAAQEKRGLVILSCSGGARMQEGILSLMQMAKTSASRYRLQQKGLPFIFHFDQSNHGRVCGQLCHAGRCESCRARCLGRVCRASGH